MPPLLSPDPTPGGLLTRAEVLSQPGMNPRRLTEALRRGALVRVASGIYAVPAEAPADVDLRGLLASSRLILSHGSAAAWWGAPGATPLPVVHATTPRGRGRRVDAIDGVRLHRVDLPASRVTVERGVRLTTPLQTALDCSRWLPVADAVAVCDALIRQGLLTRSSLTRGADRYRGPGKVRMQHVCRQVDPRRESLFESVAATLLAANGVPPAVPQYVVRRRGRFVARVDFAWPWLRVALECDGFAYHRDTVQFRRDRRRWAALTVAGWRVVSITWADLTTDPGYVVELLRTLLAPAPTPASPTLTTATAPAVPSQHTSVA